MWKILCLGVLLCFLHQVFGETGCPDPDDIKPCTCATGPFPILDCKNVTSEELRQVFTNSERYKYKEVYIKNSIMQYLPKECFEKVEVNEIYLTNVTLSSVFDEEPNALDKLWKLHIENCKVKRGIFWRILAPLKSLRIVNIYFHVIKTLGKDFMEHAPRGLEQLTFYGTETVSIKPGVFENFTSLDKVAVDHAKLTKLTRDIFPTPFNGRILYFNDNKISTISDGLFSNMPNLQTLGLRKNQIGKFPKEAFDSPDDAAKVQYLFLDDNPLKCDCDLVWLMDNRPETLQGTCVSPKKLAGKELKDLSSSDFNC